MLFYYREVVNMVAYRIYRYLKGGDRIPGVPQIYRSGL